MQTVLQSLCSDINHSLKPAFILLTAIATSEEERKLNAMGIQLVKWISLNSSLITSLNSMILVITGFLNACVELCNVSR